LAQLTVSATGASHPLRVAQLVADVDELDLVVSNFERQLPEDLVGEGWGHGDDALKVDHHAGPPLDLANDPAADLLAENPAAENGAVFLS
jgi:hypothetical protein